MRHRCGFAVHPMFLFTSALQPPPLQSHPTTTTTTTTCRSIRSFSSSKSKSKKKKGNDSSIVNSSIVNDTDNNSNKDDSIEDGKDAERGDDSIDTNTEEEEQNQQQQQQQQPTLKLFPVYTRFDVQDLIENSNKNILSLQYKEDAALAIQSIFDISHIQRHMQRSFGSDENNNHSINTELEYYNDQTHTWMPLQTQDHVDQLKSALEALHPLQYNRLIPVKVPRYYDEFTQNDDEEEEYHRQQQQQQQRQNQTKKEKNSNNNNNNNNDEFDDIDHPSNIMNDPSGIPPNTMTNDYMDHLPTAEPNSKQEQVLVLLAHVVEQVIQKLHAPDCRYTKLYTYTTANTSMAPQQRLIVKTPRTTMVSPPSPSMMMKDTTIETNSRWSKNDYEEQPPITPTTTAAPNDDDDEKMVATTTTTTTKPSDDQQQELDEVIYGDVPPDSNSTTTTTSDDEPTSNTYQDNDGFSIDTRVFIMELASVTPSNNSTVSDHIVDDSDLILAENLRTVIMAYPHALDHIANCIHMFQFDSSSSSSSSSRTTATTADGNTNSSSK